MSVLRCTGCGTTVPVEEPLAFSCPKRGQGSANHVLRVEPDALDWSLDQSSQDPFVRYRKRSYSYVSARSRGMQDARYVELVSRLSEAIEKVDRAPCLTPMQEAPALKLWFKNETLNVSGSHKARHLIGTCIHLAVAKDLGSPADAPLAIASCGNAALAAAVVARAAERELQVYVPPWADERVVAKLRDLGASIIVCTRESGAPAGDPCYLRFREAVCGGALPFSCQGGDNALALVGGHTLGWEIMEQSTDVGFDEIFVQVGGGALASSLMQAFTMAYRAKRIAHLPRFYAVQTDNAHPLKRAWQRLQDSDFDLAHARANRQSYMWPWESEPKSVASGILDDETYDWYSILESLHASGGSVLTVSETCLREAQRLAQESTGVAVDATGTAGLAGLLKMRQRGSSEAGARALVLFTGAIR